MKHIRSNLLWCVMILLAKGYNHCIGLLRIFSFEKFQFGPPKVWNRPTKKRVEQWNKKGIQASNSDYITIYKANQTHKKLPKTIEKTIHPWLLDYANEPQYEAFVASIPDGKICGTYTNITPDNRILRDCAGYLGENTYSNYYTYQPYLGKFENSDLTIAIASGNDSFKNYCHWMTFVVPRIHLFQKSGLKIDKYAIDCSTGYHKDSLKALGISQDDIIVTSPQTRIQAKHLLVGSTTTTCCNMPQRSIDFLRTTFLGDGEKNNNDKNDKNDEIKNNQNNSETSIKSPKKIYISRIDNGKTNQRKVANEQEVFEYLQTLGFERVVMEGLSVWEQAQLFNNAEIVVGPHGAGLTNLVFCNPGTKVIELFQPKNAWGHFYCLSNSCNLDYYYIMGESIVDRGRIAMDWDTHIPLEKLEATLKLAGI